MATPFLNHTETSLNLQIFKKNPKKSNLISFWAFLLSIFIYISVFYVFNLSPSTLAYTPIFWFIISNTLILIIAADFGAFSSSKDHDFFEDKSVGARAKRNTSIPCFEIVQYARIEEKEMPVYLREEVDDREPQEKIIDMVSDHQIIQKTVQNKPAEKSKEKIVRKCRSARRSKKEVKVCLKRTLSEAAAAPRLDENEFSRMSDDELNKRVEEFIQRCNRQIRLEAVN